MRRIRNIAIFAVSIGGGVQFALDGRWWAVMVCGLVGILWLLQSKLESDMIPTVSLLILTLVVGAGIFFGHNLIWLLTNLVFILVAWDLDRFTRDLHRFSMGQTRNNNESVIIQGHLSRLGVVAILGWSLGVMALNLQVSLNFTGALILGTLALISLRFVIRFLVRESGNENP